MKKKKYYNISNVLKTDAEYMILIGKRNYGKIEREKQWERAVAKNEKEKIL